MDIEKTLKNLKARHFDVSVFDTGSEASEYLCREIGGAEVGIGGCKTAADLGLYGKLTDSGCRVYWHWEEPGWETLEKANAAPVYICSANAIAESGEILNIDGRGNRVSAITFGKKRVYIVAGTNKICPDFDSALYRARNVAAVQNLARFDKKVPCKFDGKCHDCRSPERACNALTVLWGPMWDMEKVEVVLIKEELGL